MIASSAVSELSRVYMHPVALHPWSRCRSHKGSTCQRDANTHNWRVFVLMKSGPSGHAQVAWCVHFVP